MPVHESEIMKPDLLIVVPSGITPEYIARLEKDFTVHFCPTAESQQKVMEAGLLKNIRGVFTSGSVGIKPELLKAMPNVEIVCCKGTGYDALDMDEMRRRGLFVTHGAGANAPSVADHAFGLMLSTLRQIPKLNDAIRQGKWASSRNLQPILWRKRIGILGFGKIGREIAKRALAFDMTVAYHARSKRDDVSFTYYATPLELAKNSDILVVCTPGGVETKKMVNRQIIDALGPTGYIVNVARGSVVDTDELVAALQEGRLAGAGVDVVEGEPEIPSKLYDLPNLVMTPHIAARSPEASDMALELVTKNLQAHFSGKPVLTPVPDSAGRRRDTLAAE